MSEHTVNEERGEVAIVLDGATYPMRPSYEAMVAIEAKLGSLVALSYRHANPLKGLTVHDLATIIMESVRAAGKDRNDPMLTGVSHDKVARLIAADGMLSAVQPVERLLVNMITGGSKKKENPPPATQESPTAS